MATPSHPARKRIIILGHRGFIGSALCRRFTRENPGMNLLGLGLPEFDLASPEVVAGLGADLNPDDVVIVCAAIKRQLGDTLDTFDQNLRIVLNLARLFQKHPPGRIVYLSSAAVYGENTTDLAIDEQTPPRPQSLYGLSKLNGEILLRTALTGREGTSLLCVRPALVYGPGDQGGYGPTGFLKSSLRAEPVTLWGDGSELREFVFIDDAAHALHALALGNQSGTVNLVGGQSSTFAAAMGFIRRAVPSAPLPQSRPRSRPKADHAFDNSLLRQWVPDLRFTDLEHGIRLTLAGLQKGSP